MLNHLNDLLQENKKIVIPISSVKIGNMLHEFLQEKKIKCLAITGD